MEVAGRGQSVFLSHLCARFLQPCKHHSSSCVAGAEERKVFRSMVCFDQGNKYDHVLNLLASTITFHLTSVLRAPAGAMRNPRAAAGQSSRLHSPCKAQTRSHGSLARVQMSPLHEEYQITQTSEDLTGTHQSQESWLYDSLTAWQFWSSW